MTQSVLEMAKDLTVAQIEAGNVPREEMGEVLGVTFTTLQQLHALELGDPNAAESDRHHKWKQSIGRHAVTCLECGATFKQLTIRHLRMHDLDGRSYRSKYGIPHTQSLSAREVLSRRREVIKAVRPWDQKPSAKQEERVLKRKQPARKKRPLRKVS